MNSIPSWLPDKIRDLAAIDDEGQLADLRMAYAAECRARIGASAPSKYERHQTLRAIQAGAALQAREVARTAAILLDLPLHHCEAVARDVLLRHPWRDIAIELIDGYRGRSAIHHRPVAGKIQQRPAWRRVV